MDWGCTRIPASLVQSTAFQHHAFFCSNPTMCGFPPPLKQPWSPLIPNENAGLACNTCCDVPWRLEQVWYLSL